MALDVIHHTGTKLSIDAVVSVIHRIYTKLDTNAVGGDFICQPNLVRYRANSVLP